ncbi:PDZ domain (Also known as DHR or GLGF) [compost metagenome]
MSGLEVYAQENKSLHYYVSRIEPGSPAEIAGVMVDDEIVSINFVPIASYKLNEINTLFKSADGKNIILTIYRNKELIIKVFKLKQRI